MPGDHQRSVQREFSHQAGLFQRSPLHQADVTTTAVLDVVPVAAGSRWLDVACGTGIMTRHLAARGGFAIGVDLTPEMLAVARRESERLDNVRFVEGDATRLPFPDGAFDGALTRFSLHHVPLPGRVVREMARVVRPGGVVAVADHLASPTLDAHRRHQAAERLRDPSHWENITRADLAALGRDAGLRRRRRAGWDFDLDFEEWLTRGSGGEANRDLVLATLGEPPDDPCCRFDGSRIGFRLAVYVWMKQA